MAPMTHPTTMDLKCVFRISMDWVAGATSGACQVAGIVGIHSSHESLVPGIAMVSFMGAMAPPFILKKQLGDFKLQPYLVGILAFQLSALAVFEVQDRFPEGLINQSQVKTLSLN